MCVTNKLKKLYSVPTDQNEKKITGYREYQLLEL